jgi:superfamily II DNA/RNA helicase
MGKLKVRNVRAVVIDEGDRLVSDELFPATKAFFDNLFAGAVSGRDTSGGRSRREDGEGGGLPAGGAGQAQGRGGGRQIVACSATVAGKGRERLLGIMGAGAVFLETEEQELLRERISHWAFFSENRKKLDCLCSFLAASRAKKALVFTDNTSQIGNMAARLQYHKIAANGLCSDMDKAARKQAVADFRLGRIRVLVSSDLASRGLDIPDISHVISLDVPFDTDAYIHRAGRTARAGKKGIMTTIGNEEEMRRLALLEKKLGIAVYPKALYQGRIVAANEE